MKGLTLVFTLWKGFCGGIFGFLVVSETKRNGFCNRLDKYKSNMILLRLCIYMKVIPENEMWEIIQGIDELRKFDQAHITQLERIHPFWN